MDASRFAAALSGTNRRQKTGDNGARTVRGVISVHPDADAEMSSALKKLAVDCIARADGNVVDASVEMMRCLRADPELLVSVEDGLLRRGCQEILRAIRSESRSRAWNSPEGYDASGRGYRLLGGMLDHARDSLLDFPLPETGKVLRKATRADIDTAVQFYRSARHDAGWKERWLNLVSLKVAPGKVVADVLDEKSLAALKKKAQHTESA